MKSINLNNKFNKALKFMKHFIIKIKENNIKLTKNKNKYGSCDQISQN